MEGHILSIHIDPVFTNSLRGKNTCVLEASQVSAKVSDFIALSPSSNFVLVQNPDSQLPAHIQNLQMPQGKSSCRNQLTFLRYWAITVFYKTGLWFFYNKILSNTGWVWGSFFSSQFYVWISYLMISSVYNFKRSDFYFYFFLVMEHL